MVWFDILFVSLHQPVTKNQMWNFKFLCLHFCFEFVNLNRKEARLSLLFLEIATSTKWKPIYVFGISYLVFDHQWNQCLWYLIDKFWNMTKFEYYVIYIMIFVFVSNIKKPLVLWLSPWYKWPALISRIFLNWPSL